jgi:cation:H+ antiporter
MTHILLLVIGFALVLAGADSLVKGASSLAKKLRVSDLVVGLTVVAFGTSMPELSVNIIASIKGSGAIALGNIVGSNISNILLILGVSAIIFPLAVTKGTVWREVPLSLLAAILVGILGNDRLIDKACSSALSRVDGLVLLCFFVIFGYYSIGIARRIEGIDKHMPKAKHGPERIIILLAVGLLALTLGSRWVVTGAVHLAGWLGVSHSLIALTVVAMGTSLPELATSAVAAYRRNAEIAIGNIVGSNIFNIFFILAVSSIIRPIPLQADANIDVAVLIGASLALFLCMFTGKRRTLDRWEGCLFVAAYLSYIAFLVKRG